MLNWTAPKYFETLGTPLLAGRDFAFEDQGGPLVAIVSQSMARHYFRDRSAIGQLFTFDRLDNRGMAQEQPYRIVGVVGDTKYLNLQEPIRPMVYLHAFQGPRLFAHQFSMRTNVRPEAVAAQVRRTVHELLPTVTVARVTTMTDQVDASMIPERLIAMLSGFFGALAALLAAIGLYGLLAYTVVRRTSEIGIRMALGATAGDVVKMVLLSALGSRVQRAGDRPAAGRLDSAYRRGILRRSAGSDGRSRSLPWQRRRSRWRCWPRSSRRAGRRT